MIIIGLITGIALIYNGYQIAKVGSEMRIYQLLSAGYGWSMIQNYNNTRSLEGWTIMTIGLMFFIGGLLLTYVTIKYIIRNRSVSW